MTSSLFTAFFLISTFFYTIMLLWLNIRQNKATINSLNKVPNEFAEKITLKQHQKAAYYTQSKLKVNNFEVIFAMGMLLFWTLGGGLNWLEDRWHLLSDNSLYIGTGFIVNMILIGVLIDLPFSLYRTFILEEKFGFNKTTISTLILDLLKGLVLILLIGLPFIYSILYLMQDMGKYWWIFVWLMLIGFSLLALWLYPTFIAPLFNQFKSLEDQELKVKINNLLKRTGFESDGIFIMDGSKRSAHGNAYFTGIGKNKRIVFFDTLLQEMTHKEIEAILAHELGHFHHKHIRQQMLTSFGISFIGLASLGYLITQNWFFQGLGVSEMNNHIALVLFMLILPVFSFFIEPITHAVSRKNEFEADTFSAKHTSSGDLISSLVKLYRDNAATLTPDRLYSLFHDSHPSASIRIGQLKKQ